MLRVPRRTLALAQQRDNFHHSRGDCGVGIKVSLAWPFGTHVAGVSRSSQGQHHYEIFQGLSFR